MTGWTSDELARIGAADELEIAPVGADGTLRRPVTIWVVRVGDELYIRSWRGAGGGWWRNAQARGAGRIGRRGGVLVVITTDNRHAQPPMHSATTAPPP